MSKNLVINGVTYNGIDSMEIPNADGEKVVFVPVDEAGVDMPESMEITLDAEIDRFKGTDSVARVHAKTTEAVLLGEGAEVNLHFDKSVFGDASAFDVNIGSTFTSKLGMRLEGQRIPPVLSDLLPEMTVHATADDIVAGKEAIDSDGNVLVGTMPNNGAVNANLSLGGSYTIPEGYHDGTGVVQGAALPTLANPATAADIARGKQAIDADGNKITGRLDTVGEGEWRDYEVPGTDGDHFGASGTNEIYLYGDVTEDTLFRAGSDVGVTVPTEFFGDATAEDVAAGKTFTSAAGLKVVGTAQGGGGSMETCSARIVVEEDFDVNIFYTGANGPDSVWYTRDTTITVVKNTVLVVESSTSMCPDYDSSSGGYEVLTGDGTQLLVAYFTEDGEFYVMAY